MFIGTRSFLPVASTKYINPIETRVGICGEPPKKAITTRISSSIFSILLSVVCAWLSICIRVFRFRRSQKFGEDIQRVMLERHLWILCIFNGMVHPGIFEYTHSPVCFIITLLTTDERKHPAIYNNMASFGKE